MKEQIRVTGLGIGIHPSGEEMIEVTGTIYGPFEDDRGLTSHNVVVYFPLDEDFTETDLIEAFMKKELKARESPVYKRQQELSAKWLGKAVEIELPDPEEE